VPGLLGAEAETFQLVQRRGGGLDQVLGADGAPPGTAGGPQLQGQCPAGVQPFLPGEGRDAVGGLLTLDLPVEPVVEDLPVQLRSPQRLPGPLGRIEAIVRQLGDEGQHPRIAGQPQQVLDLLDPVEPALGPRDVTEVEACQKVADLGVGEVLQLQDPGRVPTNGLLAHDPAELTVVPEMLGPAGQHDLRLTGRGLQQLAQIGRRRRVGDLLDQLVIAVQQQSDPPGGDQVPDLGGGDVADVQPDQVLGDQVVQVGALLQGPQLDQYRFHGADLLRHLTDQLVHEERLAAPEVPEHGDEPGPRLPQPGRDPRQNMILYLGTTLPVTLPEPLRHIQRGRVSHICGQPFLLPRTDPRQVDQPSVLHQRVQHHPDPAGLFPHRLGKLRPPVHEVGSQVGVPRPAWLVCHRHEPVQHLQVDLATDRAHRPDLHRPVRIRAGHDQERAPRLIRGVGRELGRGVTQPRYLSDLVQERIPWTATCAAVFLLVSGPVDGVRVREWFRPRG
jgi:hypothetical protein